MRAIRVGSGLAGAFSLIELLAVVLIIALLCMFSTPAVVGVLRANQLNVAGQLVLGQLTLARQTALTSNHAVQVRLYALPDYGQPSGSVPTVYRGMQTFSEVNTTSGTAQVQALNPALFFTAPVILSDATSSTVLAMGLNSPSASGGDPALPSCQYNYRYVTIRYATDGSTNLGSATNCITLVLEPAVSLATAQNYLTLAIDPTIGTIHIFRP